MSDHIDIRVIKTRDSIERAFIRLLGEKDFERITVQNILDEALVNRKTFYKHYQDKYNLADIMVEKLIHRFTQTLDKRFAQIETSPNFPYALRDFYNSLLEERECMLALFKVHTPNHVLWDDLKALLKSSYADNILKRQSCASDLEMDYLNESYAAIVLSSIRWFLERGNDAAIDVITNVSLRRLESPAYSIPGLPFD